MEMESVYIIGNSMVDYLEVEGTVKVCQGGATLHCLKGEIERRDGLKLIVGGIPDLFEKGRCVAVGPMIDVVEKDLEFVSAMPGVVRCPMYPVRSMVQQQWCTINAQKCEGTSAAMTKVIGRQRDGARLTDEAHSDRELAEEMTEM